MKMIIIVLLLSIGLIGWLLSSKSTETREKITVLIALVALIISILSGFKDTIFPFRLKVITDEIILAKPTAPSHDSFALVIPLTFINEGNGSGVIEGISIKVEGQNSTKIYTPIAEIDFGKFIVGKKALHAENIIGTYNSFPISGKSSAKKHILFTQEEKSKKYPFSSWEPDDYEFRIFIKTSRHKNPKEYISMDYKIMQETIDQYQKGSSISLSKNKELNI